MNWFAPDGPWLTLVIAGVLFLVIFRRPLGWLLRLLVRAGLALGALALWSASGVAAGLTLGSTPSMPWRWARWPAGAGPAAPAALGRGYIGGIKREPQSGSTGRSEPR